MRDDGTVVRKLIGHSGPVYSLSFDPMAGASAAPSHLLSSSQDGSVRLWSIDTWQNVVVYKGHADPIWDVQWAPMGVHFATASRDRTARLWMTERIAPVRMYAGHLSDVEVRWSRHAEPCEGLLTLSRCSVYDSIPTPFTLRLDRVTDHVDCGTYIAAIASESSSSTRRR
jgi:WD40 repeat protein